MTTTIAIDYDRVPRLGASSWAEEEDNSRQSGHNDYMHYLPSSHSVPPPIAKTTQSHQSCSHRPFEDDFERPQPSQRSSSQVPFSPQPKCQHRRRSGVTRELGRFNLTPFLSSSTRHRWCIMIYTLLSLLLLMSNHLVDSILVRGGSENNRAPPAPVKGKS